MACNNDDEIDLREHLFPDELYKTKVNEILTTEDREELKSIKKIKDENKKNGLRNCVEDRDFEYFLLNDGYFNWVNNIKNATHLTPQEKEKQITEMYQLKKESFQRFKRRKQIFNLRKEEHKNDL